MTATLYRYVQGKYVRIVVDYEKTESEIIINSMSDIAKKPIEINEIDDLEELKATLYQIFVDNMDL